MPTGCSTDFPVSAGRILRQTPVTDAAAATPNERTAHGTAFLAELRAATALLHRIAADRALLVGVPAKERLDFVAVVAQVFHPDAKSRRSMVKATSRERKLEAARKDDARLQDTGIRTLRRQPVFTTPNVYRLNDPRDQDTPDASAAPATPDAIAEATVPHIPDALNRRGVRQATWP